MPDSPSGDALPPYSLPVYTHKKRTDSFVSSFENFDLEKAAPSPTTPDTQSISPFSSPTESHFPTEPSEEPYSRSSEAEHGHGSREDDLDSEPTIHISDEHPPSTPPSPVGARYLAPPAYHRPFSPPVAWPSAAHTATRKASAGSISIMIHTETRMF